MEIGQVSEAHTSSDNVVRHVDIRYKIPTCKTFKRVKRAVQSLVVLLPAEEDTSNL